MQGKCQLSGSNSTFRGTARPCFRQRPLCLALMPFTAMRAVCLQVKPQKWQAAATCLHTIALDCALGRGGWVGQCAPVSAAPAAGWLPPSLAGSCAACPALHDIHFVGESFSSSAGAHLGEGGGGAELWCHAQQCAPAQCAGMQPWCAAEVYCESADTGHAPSPLL